MREKLEPARAFERAQNHKTTVTVRGEKIRLRRSELTIRAQVAAAVKGDVNAADLILRLYKHYQLWGEFEADIELILDRPR